MGKLEAWTWASEPTRLMLAFSGRRVLVRSGDVVFGYEQPCGCIVIVDVSLGLDDRPGRGTVEQLSASRGSNKTAQLADVEVSSP